jgi:hypothetical protein
MLGLDRLHMGRLEADASRCLVDIMRCGEGGRRGRAAALPVKSCCRPIRAPLRRFLAVRSHCRPCCSPGTVAATTSFKSGKAQDQAVVQDCRHE